MAVESGLAEASPAVAARGGTAWRYVLVALGLVVVQQGASSLGVLVSHWVPTRGVDPGGWFLAGSVHHVVQGLIALALIALLWRRGFDVFLRVGDWRRGLRWVLVGTGVFVVVQALYGLVSHAVGGLPGMGASPPAGRSLAGYLSFQLLLTGTTEELLFRVLPIVVLAGVASVVVVRRWDLRLEVVVAAVMFSGAHIGWWFGSSHLTINPMQLAVALVLGVVNGMVLLRTRSVLYPMAMHSLWNVLTTVTWLVF